MSKTVSCRLSSETHGKLLDKCNDKGLTVNDFVKVLVQSALDGTPELAQDSTSNRLDSTKKSETDFQEKINDMTLTELEKELGIIIKRDESNIDRSDLGNWIRDLDRIDKKKTEKLISDKYLKGLGLA